MLGLLACDWVCLSDADSRLDPNIQSVLVMTYSSAVHVMCNVAA